MEDQLRTPATPAALDTQSQFYLQEHRLLPFPHLHLDGPQRETLSILEQQNFHQVFATILLVVGEQQNSNLVFLVTLLVIVDQNSYQVSVTSMMGLVQQQ